MSDTNNTRLLEDMELVNRQLYCVKHLCSVVSDLAESNIRILTMMGANQAFGHHMIKRVGEWTNWFMQEVSEMLNNMDANDPEEDKRWKKTFEQAGERWKNLLDEMNGKNTDNSAPTTTP